MYWGPHPRQHWPECFQALLCFSCRSVAILAQAFAACRRVGCLFIQAAVFDHGRADGVPLWGVLEAYFWLPVRGLALCPRSLLGGRFVLGVASGFAPPARGAWGT